MGRVGQVHSLPRGKGVGAPLGRGGIFRREGYATLQPCGLRRRGIPRLDTGVPFGELASSPEVAS